MLCSKISDDSKKLMNPTQHTGDDSYEDMMEIYEFGQVTIVVCRCLLSQMNYKKHSRAVCDP